MLAATLFSIAFALFLGVCALVHFLTEPAHDPFSDAADWDGAALPQDFKTLFHDTQNNRGGQ